MDITGLISIVVIIAICIIILTVSKIKKIKTNRQNLNIINQLASEKKCVINDFEFDSDLIIAFDSILKYLFFVNKKNNVTVSIDLNTIKGCKINEISRSVKTTTGMQKVVDKLELILIPKDEKFIEQKIEFYNSEIRHQIINELVFIEKWNSKINQILKNKY